MEDTDIRHIVEKECKAVRFRTKINDIYRGDRLHKTVQYHLKIITFYMLVHMLRRSVLPVAPATTVTAHPCKLVPLLSGLN